MAHIHRLGKKWRAEVQRRGVRKTAVWPTRMAAKAWAAKVEAEILGGLHGERRTTQRAVDRYLREVASKKRSARGDAIRLARALPLLPERLDQIEPRHVAAWRDGRLARVQGATVLREAHVLRGLFRVARNEWGWMSADPFEGVRMPPENPPRHQRWTWREIIRVLRALGYRHGHAPRTEREQAALAFMIALASGLRLSEILRLAPGCVRAGTVVLRNTKTDRWIKIPLPRRAVRLCARVPAWTLKPSNLTELFGRVRRECLVLDLTFHDARATALTLLARRMDVMTLARISRHKNINILVNTYYRETAEEIAQRLKR